LFLPVECPAEFVTASRWIDTRRFFAMSRCHTTGMVESTFVDPARNRVKRSSVFDQIGDNQFSGQC
jgi:hypothetical protein